MTLRLLPIVIALTLPAFAHAAPRTVALAVTDDGFVPADVAVKRGEALRLVVTRTTDATCATDIVIPEYGIAKALPLNEPVVVELTPAKTGRIVYGCAMDQMIGGVITVE